MDTLIAAGLWVAQSSSQCMSASIQSFIGTHDTVSTPIRTGQGSYPIKCQLVTPENALSIGLLGRSLSSKLVFPPTIFAVNAGPTGVAMLPYATTHYAAHQKLGGPSRDQQPDQSGPARNEPPMDSRTLVTRRMIARRQPAAAGCRQSWADLIRLAVVADIERLDGRAVNDLDLIEHELRCLERLGTEWIV